MRHIILKTSFGCFVAGTICFAIFFTQLLRLIIDMPVVEIEKLLSQGAPIQCWGWSFFALYLTGFLILFFVRDEPKKVER